MEGLVQQLFNPAVAFTSVPLNENDNPIPFTEEPVQKKETTHMLDSYYMVPNPESSDDTVTKTQEKLNTLTINNPSING